MSDAEMQRDDAWAFGRPLVAGDFTLGIYQPSPETLGYWQGVSRRELMVRWCVHCKRSFHPKRIVCSDCGACDLEWRKVSGKGWVYSFSEVHRAPNALFSGSAPYVVGIVRLDEGVYIFTRFFAGALNICIDARVQVDFRELETGQMLPVFVLI